MGGSGSSSKKISSKRKRDKKKKGRRKELKRRRHKYDSVSSFSDDESDRGRRKNKNRKPRHNSPSSSSSVDHSSSSDFDSLSTHDRRHMHSKARQSRASSKGTKKKDRKRFATTSSDSDTGNARKRKRVGRDDKPKKRSSKKRSRKHFSSSSSSDSESCSMGRCSDDERQMPTVMELDRAGDHSVEVNDDNVVITHMDNPRRLKSVIAVVNQSSDEEENNRWEMDPHKEVIVYDREDYPSPKSLDSNEGESKMGSDDNSPGASSKRVCIENVADEEAIEPGKRDLESNVENEGASMAGLGGDNLESILRQKALENLRKFRGKLQVGPKSTVSNGVQDKTMEQERYGAQEVNRSGPTLQRNFSQLNEVKNIGDVECIAAEQIVDSGGGLVGCLNEEKGQSSRPVLAKHDVRDDTSQALANTSGGPVTGDNSIVNPQNEDTNGSQFEQRTMSVMRGGEMVQVNYKVYIPKKTPALARRQLRR